MTNRTVLIRLRADVSDFVAKSQLAKAAVRSMNDEIDKSNDRTAWLAQGILALTPAITRLGAGAVPVLSGIVTQMTVGAAAAGTAALAFNGVGDALGALNDYQLDPTEANLAKLNETMAKIGPNGQELVEFLDSLGPAFATMANSARGGMFPGVIQGIEDFMDLAPQLNDVVREIGEGMGQLAMDAGAGLSGESFESFFDYLETRAKPILVEMGRTLGNFINGLANMIVAFDSLTADFSAGLLEMSRSFEQWSAGLSESQGFQEFVDYVREAGPDALDFLGSFVMALVELAEAAAPVGAVMLPVLTGMLDVLGDLANTPLGPIALGFLALTSAWGRLNAVAAITGSGVMAKATKGLRENVTATRNAVPSFQQLGSSMAFAAHSQKTLITSMESGSKAASRSAAAALNARGQVQAFGRAAAPIAGQVGLLAVAMSDLDDKAGLTNTTSLALAGSLAGPYGAAVGAAAGFTLDLRAAASGATEALDGLGAAAESGDIDALTKRIADAKAELEDFGSTDGFGDWFSDVSGDLFTGGIGEGISDIYVQEIKEAEAELARLKNARQDAADDDALYNSLMAETAALEANIAAMREKRAEAIRGLNAELDYKASILDARDALKENGKTVNENTREGQANLRALYGMAAAFNAQADSAKDSAAEVRNARGKFVEMAVAMGMGEDAARRLAKRLYELPANVPIKIGVDHETAMAHAKAIKAELASIDRFIPVNIHVSRTGSGEGMYVSGGVPRAAGGTVPGQRYPYGDKVYAHLAPGEEVVANDRGQADMNRYALKAANAGARLAVLSYATGGTVGEDPDPRRRTRSGASPVEVLRLIDEFGNLARALRMSEKALTRETEKRDAAAERLEATASAMEDLASAATSQFSGDPFAARSGAPRGTLGASAGGSDPIANLLADIAYGETRDGIQRQLAQAGLGGSTAAEQGALQSVLSSGATNDQLAAILANGQTQMLEDLIIRRQGVINTTGGNAAQLALGSQFERQSEELARANDRLDNIADEVRLLRNEEKAREAREASRARENADRTSEGVTQGVNSTATTTTRHNRRKRRPRAGAR